MLRKQQPLCSHPSTWLPWCWSLKFFRHASICCSFSSTSVNPRRPIRHLLSHSQFKVCFISYTLVAIIFFRKGEKNSITFAPPLALDFVIYSCDWKVIRRRIHSRVSHYKECWSISLGRVSSKFVPVQFLFQPGHFGCDSKWYTHLPVHQRLLETSGRTGVSRGLKVIKSALETFDVRNRKDMFVYKDSTGSIFYFR